MAMIYDGTPYDDEDVNFHISFFQETNMCQGKCEGRPCHSFIECKYVDEKDLRRMDYLGMILEE